VIHEEGTVIAAHDDVLDPRTPALVDVETRLDAEGHPLLEWQLIPGDDVGLLMGFQADAVAGAMDEVAPQSSVLQQSTGNGVHLGTRDSGSHRGHGLALGALEGGISVEVVPTRITECVRASLVAAISVGHGPADVDHDGIAPREDTIRHLMVRACAMRTGSHDHEIDAHVARLQDERRNVATDLTLGAADSEEAGDLRVHGVDGGPGACQGCNLFIGLAHTQGRQHRAGRTLHSFGHGRPELQDLDSPHVIIKSDPTCARHETGYEAIGVIGLIPRDDVYAGCGQRRGRSRGALKQRSDQDGLSLGRDHEARESFERDRFVAGQVAQIRARRDEEGVQTSLPRARGRLRQPLPHVSGEPGFDHGATLPRHRPVRRERHHGPVSSSPRGLLLDSASLYYRSYFALPETLVSPDGIPINAVRGFLDTVAALVTARNSAPVIACWDDDWRPQWRVDLVPSYKTHRVADAEAPDEEAVPDTLAPQVDILREILPLLGVPVVGAPEAEADDVIADLSHVLAGDVDIASGDRDLVQLVSPRVTLLYTGGTSASRGGRPWVDIDPSTARDRFGVPAELYADLAILRGDPSDGLPGAKGIGDKTAVALIQAFGALDGILTAADDPNSTRPMTPAIRRSLLASATQLRAAEQAVRLTYRPGRSALPTTGSPDPARALALAAAWGVQAAAGRVTAALQAVAE
jgi:5'-3' exonuclease